MNTIFRPCRPLPACLLMLAPCAHADESSAPILVATHQLERVTVSGERPSSLPIEIPTTLESITGAAIEQRINATDAEDALKYLPSLLVRKRYIGDHDHAVLATRASGSGNSARSLVYADGMLLSNLLGNGAAFTPRWGLVTPEEIERVDVLYGPFSAAYSGNSAGAIVDVVTRLPTALEAHVKLQGFRQNFELYRSHDGHDGAQGSASLGSRAGGLAWWINLNRLHSDAQPLGYVNRLVANGSAGSAGTPVTGALAAQDPRRRDWLLLGSTGRTDTLQDHAKLKLAYELTPALRLAYTLGYWRNDAERGVQSWLRDGSGAAVTTGSINIDGRSYTLVPSDFAASHARLEHLAHGLSLKSHGGERFDWEASASRYDYAHDRVVSDAARVDRAQAGSGNSVTTYPAVQTRLDGSGWQTHALKASWRPDGKAGAHTLEFGAQHDAFRLRQRVDERASGLPVSAFRGDTTLSSLWLQDAWRIARPWRAVLGLRLEQWRAFDGAVGGSALQADATPVPALGLGARRERHVSPKAALAWQPNEAWTCKASLGRAVRMPTVSELYQGAVAGDTVVNNDPDLKPEKSWTGELSAERLLDRGLLRATLFAERSRDALYSQTNVTVQPNVVNIQNVDAIRTRGVELAAQAEGVGVKGLDLLGSLTYADSVVTRNDNFPASVGQRQPRVPRWRASALASYAWSAQWSASLGARYSGRQYGQLDNSDRNGDAYTGFSRYLVADLRLQYRPSRSWTASLGIDNLGDKTYWAFHPYPQRTYHAELRYDL